MIGCSAQQFEDPNDCVGCTNGNLVQVGVRSEESLVRIAAGCNRVRGSDENARVAEGERPKGRFEIQAENEPQAFQREQHADDRSREARLVTEQSF